MRRSGIFVFLVFLTVVCILVSCKKDVVPELTTYNVPQATIKGKAFAQLDVSTASPGFEYAPSGAKLILRVSLSDFGIDLGGSNNSYKTYDATVSATGDYSFTIDATTAGINASIYCVQFDYLQYQGKDLAGLSINIRKVYYFNTQVLSVIAGQTVISDITYNTK